MGSFKSPCRNAQNRVQAHWDHSWSFSVRLLQSLRLVHQLCFGTLGIGLVFSTLGIIPSEFWYSWFTLAYFTFGTLVGTLSVLVVFCWYTSQLFGALESLISHFG